MTGIIVNKKYDNRISFFVAFYFFASAANATMKNVLPIPESLWGAISAMWGFLIMLFMLRALKPVWRRSSKILLSSYAIFILAYLISIVMCSSRGEPLIPILKATAFLTFAWWIPIGVAVCSINDKLILYNTYLKVSYWISAAMFINLIFHRTVTLEGGTDYDMFFGFSMITPTLIHLNEYYKNKTKWILILSIIEILALLLYGNRSIVLSIIFFVVFKSIIVNQSKNLLRPIILCLVFLFIYLFWEEVVFKLISFFDLFGMHSRTLEMTINGSVYDTSGRDTMWEKCWEMIKEKPITGWGLGGEFYTLANKMAGDGNIASASAHNGLIQLLVELGVFLGSIVIFIVTWPAFRLRKIKNTYTKDLILVFFSSYGVTRMISADGFLFAPQVAVYLYLFYFHSHCQTNSIKKVSYDIN